MISSIGPLALLLTSIFFLVYFAWSVTVDRKLKSQTANCTAINSSQVNAKYVGDIFGIIISVFMLILSGWILISSNKENKLLNRVKDKFRIGGPRLNRLDR